MQQKTVGNTTHCPTCKRFGSPSLGGYCKAHYPGVKKDDPEEYEGYIGASPRLHGYGVMRDHFNKTDKYPMIKDKCGYIR